MAVRIVRDMPPDQVRRIAVAAARAALTQCVLTIDIDDEQTLVAFDATAAEVANGGYHTVFEAASAAGVEVTAKLVGFCLVRCLYRWQEDGADEVTTWFDLPVPTGAEEDGRLVRLAVRAARALALAEGDAFDTLAAVAGATETRDDDAAAEAAQAAWSAAAMFADEPGRTIRAADGAIRCAARRGDRQAVAVGLVQRAVATAESGDRLAAYDAVEAALRQAADLGDDAPATAALLAGVCQDSPHLSALRPLVMLAFPDHLAGAATILAEVPVARFLVTPVWRLDAVEMGRVAFDLAGTISVIEDSRFALMPPAEDTAHSDWQTWSVDHPAFRDAVPHGDSVLRDARRHEKLLSLSHEIAHVLSMIGGVGFAVLALRAAAFELELALWERVEDSPATLFDVGVAPLAEPTVLALAQAEQCLEVSRKLQVLKAVWNAWFEGVAAFGEVDADPRSDPDTWAPVTNAVMNLVDSYPPEGGWPKGAVKELFLTAEQRFAESQEANGGYRLRTYLTAHARKYFAGYATVRAVVSAWRARLDADLPPATAFAMLLHATRFGTHDAVPDLSLPLAAFSTAAEDSMLSWVAALAETGADDLTRLRQGETQLQWRDGHVTVASGPTSEDEAALVARFDDMTRAALRSLRGEHNAPAERVPGAGDECAAVMRAAAEGLAQASVEPSLNDSLLDLWLDQMTIMPVARARCPFWLNEEARSVVCAMRTTDEHVDTGTSSYSLAVFPLDDTSWESLVTEIQRRPGERLDVWRLVDLHPDESAHRGRGRNVLAFEYGAWTDVHARGVMTGSSLAPDLLADVRARLAPEPLGRLEARLASGVAGAQRTLRWLDTVETWEQNGTPYAVEEWAARVRALALDVAADSGEAEEHAGRRLLTALLGDAAGTAHAQGLQAFLDDTTLVGDIVDLLRATAAGPVETLPAAAAFVADQTEPVAALFARQPRGWDVVPFGTGR